MFIETISSPFVLCVYTFGDVYRANACYSWWTVIVEEYWLNTTACSSGAFIQQYYENYVFTIIKQYSKIK